MCHGCVSIVHGQRGERGGEEKKCGVLYSTPAGYVRGGIVRGRGARGAIGFGGVRKQWKGGG